MNAVRFIVHIKTKDACADIAKDVETKFDISNYNVKRLLPQR